MTALTVCSQSVKVARYGVGMAHTKQRHAASPVRRGTWVWLEGFREPGMTFLRRQPYYPKISYDFDIYTERERLEANWKREEQFAKVSPAKWRYGWIDLAAMVYVGWTPDGDITRDGFFNAGEWNHLTMTDAVKGLRKIVAKAKGYAVGCPDYRNDDLNFTNFIDNANLQVFVPKTTKIKGRP